LFEASGDVTVLGAVKENDGLRAELSCNGDMREFVYGQIKNTDWNILEMFQKKQTLENIFREITKEQN
jgi:hypothetical protein